MQKLLHTESFYTEKLLHREAFTHKCHCHIHPSQPSQPCQQPLLSASPAIARGAGGMPRAVKYTYIYLYEWMNYFNVSWKQRNTLWMKPPNGSCRDRSSPWDICTCSHRGCHCSHLNDMAACKHDHQCHNWRLCHKSSCRRCLNSRRSESIVLEICWWTGSFPLRCEKKGSFLSYRFPKWWMYQWENEQSATQQIQVNREYYHISSQTSRSI